MTSVNIIFARLGVPQIKTRLRGLIRPSLLDPVNTGVRKLNSLLSGNLRQMQGGFFMFNFTKGLFLFSLTAPNPDAPDYMTFTKEGKILMRIAAVAAVILIIVVYNLCFRKKNDETADGSDFKKASLAKKSIMSTKELVLCSVCIALAFICSSIKFFEMPYGGSITLFSMLFITLIGYFFGVKTGILCGTAYGIFQLLQDPWLLSPLQICFDYIFAFAALGLSGIFRNLESIDENGKASKRKGLIIGYVFAAVMRGISHVIGGYLFWMDSMPEKFPKAFSGIYPIVYNFSFIGAEIILTVIVLMLPGVSKVLLWLRREANK